MINELIERDLLPLWLLRFGVRSLVLQRLIEENYNQLFKTHKRDFIASLKDSPIAIETRAANEQHYEVPADFFLMTLGKNLKYSSAFFESGAESLDDAEESMLELTCSRAELYNGQKILELGCGWGSLTLWMGKKYPESKIIGVSNSNSQRDFILARAKERGITNIEIITVDMNHFEPPQKEFDRIVSVEMFEHMRNWPQLFKHVAQWLNVNGRFFMHIFTHRCFCYPYETHGASNWMGKYFFTGGMMPSDDLPFLLKQDLLVERHWRESGKHYSKTAQKWREKTELKRKEVIELFENVYGKDQGTKWYVRWRLFYLACEELFGFRGGKEWGVSHYLLKKRD